MASRGCSLVVLEIQWSVQDHGLYGWVSEDYPPWCYAMSLVVYRSWGASLGVANCGRDKIIPTCGL